MSASFVDEEIASLVEETTGSRSSPRKGAAATSRSTPGSSRSRWMKVLALVATLFVVFIFTDSVEIKMNMGEADDTEDKFSGNKTYHVQVHVKFHVNHVEVDVDLVGLAKAKAKTPYLYYFDWLVPVVLSMPVYRAYYGIEIGYLGISTITLISSDTKGSSILNKALAPTY
jgi:hypothetical protein